jgi:multiple sugar transport system ATP-binding protein
MPRVVLENLSKNFKSPGGGDIQAVKELSLAVEEGEFLVLAGPSGCGKTTTLRLIAGLEEPTGGTISVDGRTLNGMSPQQRDVAMVFQQPALYPHMTAHENMAFGLKLRKFSRTEIEQRVGDAAKMLGLTDCLDRRPAALSGGQRQRVAVGRALVRQPAVFLLDEPFSNLDAPMRAQMRKEISGLHTRLRATMIHVTHDQAEAMTLGDRIAVMKEGVLQQVGEPMAVYHHPANLFVAGFIGSPAMNFFRGILARDGKDVCFREDATPGNAGPCLKLAVSQEMATWLAAHDGKKVVLGIRPEHIALQRGIGDAPSGQTVDAMVELVEPMGAETHLHAAVGNSSFVTRVQGGYSIKPGEKISLMFDMRSAHFFDAATESVMVG